MAKITNNSNGPRNINTDMGFITLQPGETLGDDYKVSDADVKAMNDVGLLDAAKSGDQRAGTSSIADIQREIASAATPAVLTGADDNGGTGGDFPTDSDVNELVKANSADDLRKIADDEGVEYTADDNKADVARAILEKRAGV